MYVLQSFKRLISLALITSMFAACSEHNELDNNTAAIAGTATVAASGSGVITRAVGDISALTLHYTAKGKSEITERTVIKGGSNTQITFTTDNSTGDGEATSLFWQQVEEGTTTKSQPFYLTAERASDATLDAVDSEPLWAIFESKGNRENDISFGEMKCRMAKFTVKLDAWQSSGEALNIIPSNLKVSMQVLGTDNAASTIANLAMVAGTTTQPKELIASTSNAPIHSVTGKSQLITPQQLIPSTKIITVWYDINNDGKKDEADEVYTLDLSELSVSRPVKVSDLAFFNANEHITLTINLTMGKTLSVGTVTVADWVTGTGWDNAEGELVDN